MKIIKISVFDKDINLVLNMVSKKPGSVSTQRSFKCGNDVININTHEDYSIDKPHNYLSVFKSSTNVGKCY